MGVKFNTIDIVGRSLGQYRETTKNLAALAEARTKAAQEREDREFKKKENSIKLEKLKREGQLSSLEYDILDSQFKTYQKQQEKISLGESALIDMEEKKQMDSLRQSKAATKKTFEQDPEGTIAAMSLLKHAEQRRMLRPKFSAGKIGFEEVDLSRERQEEENREMIREAKQLEIEQRRRKLEAEEEDRPMIRESRGLDIEQKRRRIEEYDKDRPLLRESRGLDIEQKRRQLETAEEDRNLMRESKGLDIEQKRKQLGETDDSIPLKKESLRLDIEKKRRELESEQDSASSATAKKSGQKPASKFKAGDIREKNGIRYKRNENGQWLPLS